MSLSSSAQSRFAATALPARLDLIDGMPDPIWSWKVGNVCVYVSNASLYFTAGTADDVGDADGAGWADAATELKVTVAIEYFDKGTETIQIGYTKDGSAETLTTIVTKTNTKKWKKVFKQIGTIGVGGTGPLFGTYFYAVDPTTDVTGGGGDHYNADFRITSSGDLYLSSVTITNRVTGATLRWPFLVDQNNSNVPPPETIESGTFADDIQSDNFSAGSAGWQIQRDTGSAEFNNITVRGTIYATAGEIADFDIGSDYIRDTANSFGLASTVTGGDDVRFWAGAAFANRATAPFRVTELGAVTASAITITDGSIEGSVVTSANIPVIDATLTWTDHSPTTLKVAWSSFKVNYHGTRYTVAASNTANKYIWWSLSTPSALQSSNTQPAEAVDQFLLCINRSGVAYPSVLSNVIYADYISVATLSAIVADLGTITAGTITGGTIQTAASAARVVFDSTGIKGYDATTQRYQLLNDGSGWLGASTVFAWTAAGVTTAAGWTLGSTAITVGSGATTVGLDAGGTNPAIYAGSATPGSAPFRVTAAGVVTAISGAIGGWTLGATSLSSGSITLDSSAPAIRLGTATTYALGIGIWEGKDTDLTYKWRVGDPDTDYIRWTGSQLEINGAVVGGSVVGGTDSNSFTINQDLTDANVDLIFGRTTGGNATMRWNGTTGSFDKPLSVTLSVPTIADFTNATHAHAAAASGGTVSHASLGSVSADQHHAQSHVIATTAGLGADHTASGLTAGQVLRATAATTAAFQSLLFADIPSSNNPGAAAAILASAAATGLLTLAQLTVSATITGSVSGNAGTVTNGVYTNAANSMSNIAPLTTLAESWIGPSSTSGIYFKSNNVGIGTTGPGMALQIGSGTVVDTDGQLAIVAVSARGLAQSTANGNAVGWRLSGKASDGTSRNAGLYLMPGTTDATTRLSLIPDGTNEYLVVTRAGNVGIGSTTPRKLADFLSTTQSQLRLSYTDNSVYADFTVGSGGNLTVAPTGDFVFDPTGNDILPNTNYDLNLGALSKKYLTLHAAELWVETLVAQDTIATLGGRVLVAPTTELTGDVAAGDTTIYVKHNNLANGDRVYLEADGKLEFVSIDSAPGGGGPYSHTVTRDLDLTGANAWAAGDAVLNTGTTGDGFLDIYSRRGVMKSVSDGAPVYNTVGPTIVGNVRNSGTWNDWTECWAIGNLNGLYGYGLDTYGAAFGKYSAANYLTIDTTNGIRFLDADDVVRAQLSSSVWTLGVTTAEHVAVSSTAVQIKDNTTVYTDLTAGVLTLGETANSKSRTQISAGAISMITRSGAGVDATRISLAADGSGYLANSNISWDTSGNATIAGFTVTATDFYAGTGATRVEMQAAGGFWAGATAFADAPFRVSPAGVLVASSATITGTITATSGAIGGFTVDATEGLYAGTGATRVQMKAGAGFWAGATAQGSAPFRVDVTGELTATKADITGAITANSGSIGSFTIGTYLYTGTKTAYNDTNAGVHLGSDGIGIGNNVFTVSAAGALVATSATVTGAITASSGSITGTLTMSGAASAIAIGTTPPTSASAGTGIWLDRVGLYGLVAGAQQFYLLATDGKAYFGGGAGIIDANGLTLAGNFAQVQTTLSIAAGNNNDVSTDKRGFLFYNAVGAGGPPYTITGFANGTSGKRLTIFNVATTSGITVANQSSASQVGNRVITNVNSDIVIPYNGFADFIYDAADSLWVMLAGSNALSRESHSGNQQNAQVGLSATIYLGFAGTLADTTEAKVAMIMPYNATAKNLYVRTNSTQSASGTQVFTLQKNGADTALVVTVGAGEAAALFSDTTNTVAFVAGDTYSLEDVGNASSGTNAKVLDYGIEFDAT